MIERTVVINATDEMNRQEIIAIAQRVGAEASVAGNDIHVLANGQRSAFFEALDESEHIKRSPYGVII